MRKWKIPGALAAALLALLAFGGVAYALPSLSVDTARVVFWRSGDGLPRHDVRVTAQITDRSLIDSFDPLKTPFRLRIGDYVAVLEVPEAGATETPFRRKRKLWKLKVKDAPVRAKLTLDARSGLVQFRARGVNALALLKSDPEKVDVVVEFGTRVTGERVAFDAREQGGIVRWTFKRYGTNVLPEEYDPEALLAKDLLWYMMASGEKSSVILPGVRVARNAAELRPIWDTAYPASSVLPPVDFQREMVIAVYVGLVAPTRKQIVEVIRVTDDRSQLHVSWRPRHLCDTYVCNGPPSTPQCPDNSPFVFLRVAQTTSEVFSEKQTDLYDDCKK